PELPDRRLERVTKQYGLSRDQALLLTRDRAVSDFFESCAGKCRDPRKLAGWVTRDLFEHLGNARLSIEENPIPPAHFASLVDSVCEGKITERMGKEVLTEMFETGRAPEAIIEARGLKPVDDLGLLEGMLDEVMAQHPKPASELAQGASKPIDFFVGQVMKKTRGKADPKAVRSLVEKRRGREPEQG
ncbi:MAG: Asp-tRNA(Asn)/Glu-tRNA(Gln) amidotransferase GatCAB subunit B, partial [Deltaproteobacteria bacterium]|nr:Asp-tRNA(Asn)/Glu-tRNA(Gln) amidotransferase GatCAB subunit B [Deltaproteobacteria bacterium]